MKKLILLAVAGVTGCSTAPVAGLLDCVAPAKTARDPADPPPARDRDRPPRDPFPGSPAPVGPSSPVDLPPPELPAGGR